MDTFFKKLSSKSSIIEKMFFSLMLIFFLVKSILLIYPDLNMSYPFLAPDSYDWIANGYHYEGYGVNFSFRAPGLPLLISGLDKLRILNLLPLFNQLALFLLIFFSFKLLKRYFNTWISLAAILIVFFNFFFQNFSLYILADIYSLLLIFIGFYFYVIAEDNERDYIFSALFWAISFLFQYAIIYFFPAIILHFFIFRRKITFRTILISGILGFLIIGSWMIYKKIEYGSFLYAGNQQTEFIRLHFDSIFYYIVGLASGLGLLVGFFIIFGIIYSFFLGKAIKNLSYLLLLIFTSWFAFWVNFYDANDKRFVMYALFFLFPFIAVGFSALISRLNRLKLAALAIIFLILIKSSAISYSSPFSYNELRIWSPTELRFDSFMARATYYDPNINTNFTLTKDDSGFNAVNLLYLYKLKDKNIFKFPNNNLTNIAQFIKEKNISELCINYKISDIYRWYIDRNKYGNYFKIKVDAYPKCTTPDVIINDTGINLANQNGV